MFGIPYFAYLKCLKVGGSSIRDYCGGVYSSAVCAPHTGDCNFRGGLLPLFSASET